MKIDRVQIARLRGIPEGWPDIVLGDKGLVIYGPNGVGKSSIIDAVEATIASKSTLFAEDRAGVSWEHAAPHVKGGGPPSVVVQGKIGGAPVEVKLGAPIPKEAASWIAAAQGASFVLRRYMLLKFIDAQPKHRYEQIEPFLNLDQYTQFEVALKELARGYETQHTNELSTHASKSQIVRQTFGLSADDPLNRATLVGLLGTELTKTGIKHTQEDLEYPQAILEEIEAELGGSELSQRLVAWGSAKHFAQQLTAVSLLKPLYEAVVAAAAELGEALAASKQTVGSEFLAQGRDLIQQSQLSDCPLCEQGISSLPLIDRLNERIKDDEAVASAVKTLQERIDVLREGAETARQAYSSFVIAWAKVTDAELPACYGEAAKLFATLEGITTKTAALNVTEIGAAFAAAECKPSDQIKKCDEAIASDGGGDRRSQLLTAQSYIQALQGDVVDLEASTTRAKTLKDRKKSADILYSHAEAARKAAVQTIADEVATLANSYYEEIHPNEGIAKSKLAVRQAGSGSLQLSTSFFGKDCHPLLYYSESHLDTLGLCYFLAIRKLEVDKDPSFKLLLVDDVLHSVDADHRQRLARLIKDKFGDHQMIVVTHDKYFYDRLKAVLGGGFKYLAISSWDIDQGPSISDPSTDLDRVLDPEARKGKSHDELAAAGGRFFEWMLKQLTERLEVAIPARFSREHDIGSMWPSLAAKLKKQKGFAASHPDLVSALTDNGWVRNKIGAHSNESESGVTPKEVGEFVDELANLYRATYCAPCASFVRKFGEVWRCDCPNLRYDDKAPAPTPHGEHA